MIKTRLQATSNVYSGPLDVFRKIMTNEGGPKGFYKGLGPNLLGVTPEKAIKLVILRFRKYFVKSRGDIYCFLRQLMSTSAISSRRTMGPLRSITKSWLEPERALHRWVGLHLPCNN